MIFVWGWRVQQGGVRKIHTCQSAHWKITKTHRSSLMYGGPETPNWLSFVGIFSRILSDSAESFRNRKWCHQSPENLSFKTKTSTFTGNWSVVCHTPPGINVVLVTVKLRGPCAVCVCVDIKSALNSSFVVLLTGVWETSHHTQTHTNVWTWTVCWCLWPHDQVHIINVFTWIRPMETFGGCDTFTLTSLLHLSEGSRVNVWKPGSVVQVSRCLWKDDLDVNVGAARGPAAGYGPAARPVYFTASAPGWKL